MRCYILSIKNKKKHKTAKFTHFLKLKILKIQLRCYIFVKIFEKKNTKRRNLHKKTLKTR
jgi:hypothetical protein